MYDSLDRMTGKNAQAYVYDPGGNMTDMDGEQFGYGAGNRLTMIYGSDSAKKANGVRTPDIFAIMQSNNLYAHAMNNPVIWFSRYEVSDGKTI